MKDVVIKDDKNFYKNIKKYKNDDQVIVHFKYGKKDITDDRQLLKNMNKELKEKIFMVHAINIKDKRKRYEYIYDIVCEQLDSEFKEKNLCNFNHNKCISVKNKNHCPESNNGCCYGRHRGLCKYYKNKKCTIKSISCKLFTCKYLKKKKIKYRCNDFNLLKYFFNIRQKYILENSIFKDKEEIIRLLIK